MNNLEIENKLREKGIKIRNLYVGLSVSSWTFGAGIGLFVSPLMNNDSLTISFVTASIPIAGAGFLGTVHCSKKIRKLVKEREKLLKLKEENELDYTMDNSSYTK